MIIRRRGVVERERDGDGAVAYEHERIVALDARVLAGGDEAPPPVRAHDQSHPRVRNGRRGQQAPRPGVALAAQGDDLRVGQSFQWFWGHHTFASSA